MKSAFLGRARFACRLSQAAYVILEEFLHLTEPPLENEDSLITNFRVVVQLN